MVRPGAVTAVLSHDLARELLKRRNNDVRIAVLLIDGDDATFDFLAELRCDLDARNPDRDETVVDYSPLVDAVVIKAAYVPTSEPDER